LAPFTLKRWYQIGSPKLPTVLPSKVDLELTPDTPKGTMTCQYMDPAIACTDFSLLALFRFLGSGWTAASFSYRTTCQRYSPGAWQHLWVSTATPCCNVLTCYYEGDISSWHGRTHHGTSWLSKSPMMSRRKKLWWILQSKVRTSRGCSSDGWSVSLL
jgi:hypothetical protein